MVKTPTITAYCENPSCGTIFISQLFSLSPGGRLVLSNIRIGPCPSCGGYGLVPDGTYTIFGHKLTNLAQVRNVRNVIRLIQSNLEEGRPVEEIQEKLSKEVPELSKFMPKNFQDVMVFIGTLMVILQFIYTIYKDQTEASRKASQAEVHVSLEMSEALEAVLTAQMNTPSSTPRKLHLLQQPKEE